MNTSPNVAKTYWVKFQVGMSFLSRKNGRKNTDSPMAKMAAPWAMIISVSRSESLRK